jgi:hypothetical protein
VLDLLAAAEEAPLLLPAEGAGAVGQAQPLTNLLPLADEAQGQTSEFLPARKSTGFI